MVKQHSRNHHIANFIIGLVFVIVSVYAFTFDVPFDLLLMTMWQIIIVVLLAIGIYIIGVAMKAIYKIDKRAEKFGRK